jgi:pimeloyl-ACP methyl ester carboxylesterase
VSPSDVLPALGWRVTGHGPPVLLLPPAASSSGVLARQQAALLGAGYQVVAVEQRGMAPPPAKTPSGPYELAHFVADAAALIDHLGLAPCHLVGASLGAFVAQELALTRPDLIRSSVLLGTRARTDFVRRHIAQGMAARTREDTPVTEFEAMCHLTLLFGQTTLGDEQRMSEWLELLSRFPARGAGPAAQYEATIIPDRRRALTAVRNPCLVVAFGSDLLTPPQLSREVQAAIPGCSYTEFDRLGHYGFLEDPAAVNDAMVRFLHSSVC